MVQSADWFMADPDRNEGLLSKICRILVQYANYWFNFCSTKPYYRVGQVVVDLGWVDIDFGHSTTCPILIGQLEVWQNGLWSWAG